MAKIIVKTQLDSSEFTKQAQALQKQIQSLKSQSVKLSVDTSGIDTKAVSAMARLVSAQSKVQVSADKVKQAELKLQTQTQKTAQAQIELATQTQKTAQAQAQLATQTEKTATTQAQIAVQAQKTTTELARHATQTEKTRTEQARLATQTEKTATAQAQAANAANKQAKSTSLLGDSLVSAAAKMAVWQVMGNLVSAPIRAFSEALDTMKEVDSQLTVIKKVTDASVEQLEAIEEQAYKTASAYGVAADEYLEAVATFSRAGYADQSEALAELAVKTQLVGDTDAETAEQFLLSVDAAYAYSGSIEELTRVLDGANEIDNKYATSIEKIAEGLGKVAPIASQAHVGIDELSAAIGTVTAVTQRSGTEAATALRALFLNIIGDTKTEIEDGATWTAGEIEGLQDVLRQYSSDAVAAAEATGQVIDPMEAIGGLAQSMKDGLLTEQELMSMVSDIGGKLRTSQLLALVENWDMYESMLSDYQNAAGSADKEVSNMMNSWEAKVNVLKNTFTEFIQATINTDWIKKLIDGTTSLIKAFGNLGNAIVTVLGAAATLTWAKNAEKVTTAFTNIIAKATAAKAAFTAAGGGLSGLSAGFSTLVGAINPVTAVLAGLTVAFTAFTFISNKVKERQEEIRQAMSDTADSVDEFSSSISELDDALAVFNDESSSRDDLVTAIGNVNQAYAEEIGQIEDVNEARRRGIELLQAETKEQAQQWQRENADSITNAQKTMSKTYMLSGKNATGISADSYNVDSGGHVTAAFKDIESAYEAIGKRIDELNEKRNSGQALTEEEENQLSYLSEEYSYLGEQIEDATTILDTNAAITAYLAGEYDTLSDAMNAVSGESGDVADAASDAADGLDEAEDAAENTAKAFDAANESSETLLKALKNLGDACDEFAEDGSLSYSTLQDIAEAFSDVDGINDYIALLADTSLTADGLNAILSELTQKKIEATYTTEQLANADVNLVAAMLDEAGVANSNAAALDMVWQAKAQIALQSGDTIEAIAATIDALNGEAQQAGVTSSYLSTVSQAVSIISSSTMSTSQQCAALNDLANSAYEAAYALELANVYSTASKSATTFFPNSETKQTEYINRVVSLWKDRKSKQKSTAAKKTATVYNTQGSYGGSGSRYKYTPSSSSSSSSRGSSGSGSSSSSDDDTDEQKEALEDRIDLLQSELKLLKAQDAPNTEIIAKNREIAQAYLDEINYLESIGASQTEINNLKVSYYGILSDIADIEEDIAEAEDDLWDELKDAVETAKDEAIDKIEAEYDAEEDLLELEEKRKAVLQAQNDLLDAQNERTVRIYNAATGQWEWVADASAVQSAKEALEDAQKDLQDYQTESEEERRKKALEDAYSDIESSIESAKNNPDTDRTTEEIISELLSNYGQESDIPVVQKVEMLMRMLNNKTYDSGGILSGMGGIKATAKNEMVLDPALTERLLAPNADSTFRQRVAELGYLYGANTASARSAMTSTANSAVSNVTNNGGPYYFNGVEIGAEAARSLTLEQLARQMRSLSLYSHA